MGKRDRGERKNGQLFSLFFLHPKSSCGERRKLAKSAVPARPKNIDQ